MKLRTIKRNAIRGRLEREYGNHRVSDVMSHTFRMRQERKRRERKHGSN